MEENIDLLLTISPIDGRYRNITEKISDYFSEYAFIKYRVKIEIDWLKFFLKLIQKEEKNIDILNDIINSFDIKEAKKVKQIEQKTNHDVKAIEYYIRKKLEENNLKEYCSFVHFACTSEDINNLAYGKMITDCVNNVLIKDMEKLIENVRIEAKKLASIPMLSHTHGQNATPTTCGKEFAIFVYRWESILNLIKNIKLKGKFSGAVGNFNAHSIAYPEIDWINIAKGFVESEGLEFNPLTTQIESHDIISILFSYIKAFNNITMDFNSDMWLYISKGYFKQKIVSGEVGSSVMPHKVNPINHENSMANIRIGNSILDSLNNNLQISRMQRDLSDSSMLRNIGVAFSHTIISINQSIKGFEKMEVNEDVLRCDLENAPEVLAEAIQTVLRKNGFDNAYEILKEFTRGKKTNLEDLREFIGNLEIPEDDKNILLNLTPENYTGLADKLCNFI